MNDLFFNMIKTDETIDKKLAKFYEMHLKCEINLTSVKNRDDFYLKHYLDSIYCFQKYFKLCGSLADMGSGGGFPGIVIAIFYPEVKITLIESIGKKCRFLENAVSALDLSNVTVINGRAEAVKGKTFNTITARGVAPVKDVIKNTWQLSESGTQWVLYKGERLADELTNACAILAAKGVKIENIRIDSPITRTYCIITR